MRITPITAEQAEEQSVGGDPWPTGDYDFIVSEAVEGVSSAGNEQIALTLHVFNRSGQKRTVYDYLSSSPKAQWKTRGFAEAVGLIRQYDNGNLNAHDMTSRPGRCKLGIQPSDGQYPAKSKVLSYLAQDKAAVSVVITRQKAPARDLDDEIPF